MTCDNCNTRYCYICGKSESKCDKKEKNESIYSHNEDWDTNENRCPMYLTQISETDDRWPGDDNDKACREFFHKLLTYTEFKKFIDKHGMDKYNELCEVFPSVLNHGYNLEEAMEADLRIIIRE